MNARQFRVLPERKVRLTAYDPAATAGYSRKEEAAKKLGDDIQELSAMQDVLYAQSTYALLIILQAMDAAGKDSIIKHVMSDVNPQGCKVVSFKAPSTEERSHDYLWRCAKALPPRGYIGIFNRSYYEEVLAVRVHPEFLGAENLPAAGKGLWKRRFGEINDFERYVTQNGIVVLKFFLHVSKEEQKKRFLERIETPAKNWKFSADDLKERTHWDEYMAAYEDMLGHTSTEWAPWYVIPADHKWFTRVAVADVIVKTLRTLKLAYPTAGRDHLGDLRKAKRMLERD